MSHETKLQPYQYEPVETQRDQLRLGAVLGTQVPLEMTTDTWNFLAEFEESERRARENHIRIGIKR